jgi:hypothetical protein
MIYLNCGYYAGNDWNRFEPAPDWTIYAFEPNPELEVPDFVIRKAVWTEETEVDFAIGGRNDAASIKGTSGHSDPKMVKVQTIDFSKFVSELPDEPIICTMDCRGFGVSDTGENAQRWYYQENHFTRYRVPPPYYG